MPNDRCQASDCLASDLKDIVEKMSEKQDKLIEFAVDIKNIREGIRELKDRSNKEHDEIFERLREIEGDTHHKDIYKALSSKISKRDVSILLSVLTFIFIAIEILFKFIVQ